MLAAAVLASLSVGALDVCDANKIFDRLAAEGIQVQRVSETSAYLTRHQKTAFAKAWPIDKHVFLLSTDASYQSKSLVDRSRLLEWEKALGRASFVSAWTRVDGRSNLRLVTGLATTALERDLKVVLHQWDLMEDFESSVLPAGSSRVRPSFLESEPLISDGQDLPSPNDHDLRLLCRRWGYLQFRGKDWIAVVRGIEVRVSAGRSGVHLAALLDLEELTYLVRNRQEVGNDEIVYISEPLLGRRLPLSDNTPAMIRREIEGFASKVARLKEAVAKL